MRKPQAVWFAGSSGRSAAPTQKGHLAVSLALRRVDKKDATVSLLLLPKYSL